jgi:phosphate transport system permease protein
MTDTTATARLASFGLSDLEGSPARRRKELVISRIFLGIAGVSVLISALIVVALVGGAFDFLGQIDLGQLWTRGWLPRQGLFDIRTLLAGSLLVTGIAMLVATPLGLGAATYLSEYANPRVRRFLKPVLETLAGIPSIVLGVFAINFLNPEIVDRFLCTDAAFFNLAAAGVGVGVLVTPLVASIAEDSMRAVPLSLREGAYGLGARKRSTTMKIVFPAAISGITAALIVGVSRAIGETMVVAIAGGGTAGSLFSLNHCDPGQTMTGAIAALAIGGDQVKGDAAAVQSLFFVGLLLFVLTLLLNVVSDRFVRRVRQRY